ncbi:MAG: efflux RND transporter periplasmic adaptor subunit, partial [Planctomycetes bacterium]|nr:efflux RND transporter periplasmic adaptor subunit [Planctomycetota bacterium]
MKKVLVSLVILLAIGAAVVLTATDRVEPQDPGAATLSPPPMVGVTTLVPEEVTITQELNGRVTPFLIAEVRPQVNGIILNRYFEEGSDVEEGMQLYQIDPATYEAQLARAEAALASAHANVKVAEAKLARYQRLIEANAVNRQEFDEVEATTLQAQAEVTIAEAEVRVAAINVEYAKVLSPISGRLGKSNVPQGALVTASQAEPLAIVKQLAQIY